MSESTNAPDLDMVAYEIRSYGCEEIRGPLVRAVAQLPEEVRRFVYEQCVFVSIPSNLHGEVWPSDVVNIAGEGDGWLVSFRSPLPEDYAEAVVAHEIAHARLGHQKMDPDTGLEVEEEAARLVAEWGFKGPPSDPEFCMER